MDTVQEGEGPATPHAAGGFGVDIGGSGIKGGPVDLATGTLVGERVRIPTPQPSVPEAVADAVAQVVASFHWPGAVGITFPAVVQHGITRTAANVDQSWIGFDAAGLFKERLGVPVTVVNDADAAGLAEVHFGAAKGVDGVVVLITFGTGIGSALFLDGELVPNTELGHLEIGGHDAETRAAASVRTAKGLSWAKWGQRVNTYLQRLEALLWPDLIIIGGGVSRKFAKLAPHLSTRTPVVVAEATNDAGIVGAALLAASPPAAQADLTGGAAPPP